jgi:DNA-binding NarL/FixJ family response regulator
VVAVGTARGGKEALAQVRELQPDVTLIDLNMPGMNGVDTVRCLLDMMPQMGIIVLTLLDSAIYRRAALRAGADEFVAKASMPTDLLPAIRRVAQAKLAEAGEEST